MKIIISLILVISFSVSAQNDNRFNQECEKLKDCINYFSKITGEQYLYSIKLKGFAKITEGLKITKENASDLISIILSNNGYTRIKMNNGLYKIVSKRDIRYIAVPTIEASFNHKPDFKENGDFMMMVYSLKSRYMADEIVRTLRPFTSRYGRIVPFVNAGKILIQDQSQILSRSYQLIKQLDVKLSKKQIKDIKRQKRMRMKNRTIMLKNKSSNNKK